MGNEVKVYTLAYNKERCFTKILETLHIVVLAGGVVKRKPIKGLGALNYFWYAARESKAAHALAKMIDKDTAVLNAHDRLGFKIAAYAKKYVHPFSTVLMMNDILTKTWIAWRRSQFRKERAPSMPQRLFNRLVDFYEVRKFILPHDKIVVLDKRTRDWVRHYFGKEAVIVRSGIDTQEFSYVPHVLVKDGEVRILMAGIFFIHRRYEDVIRAVAMLGGKGYNIMLTIAGAYTGNTEYSEYQRNIADLAHELGVDMRVVFLGQISDEKLKQSYQENDIYISANHLQSWGLAVFEAMASGCPVVVSKTAGASEVLTDEENALLVEAQNPEAYAEAIERLITDSALYAALSVNGRKFVEHSISWRKYAEGMMRVFTDVIRLR